MSSKARAWKPGVASDARGASQLVIDAVTGVTNLVENMHRNIASVSPPLGKGPQGSTKGVTGLVYRSIRGVTRAVGWSLDTVLAPLTPLLGDTTFPQREALLAAINGILGDHLAASQNPLAISMQLRQQGQTRVPAREALADTASGGKLLVLVHGLCMNDLQWAREGHDHGAYLAETLGFNALYLHYNTGLPIGHNGQAFANLLDQLVQAWPEPVTELVILGHSMGGLVARSACHHADRAAGATGQTPPLWRQRLTRLVCLGSPHLGAPLERAGHWADMLMSVSPYTAPFTRLSGLRSAGIQDLRYGVIVDPRAESDTTPGAPRHSSPSQGIIPLPQGVKCYLVAASKQLEAGHSARAPRGDGLVPVRSALGQHTHLALSFSLPAAQQRVFYGLNHFDLLSRAEVSAQLHTWLSTRLC